MAGLGHQHKDTSVKNGEPKIKKERKKERKERKKRKAGKKKEILQFNSSLTATILRFDVYEFYLNKCRPFRV